MEGAFTIGDLDNPTPGAPPFYRLGDPNIILIRLQTKGLVFSCWVLK
jgi:hypothetical protein